MFFHSSFFVRMQLYLMFGYNFGCTFVVVVIFWLYVHILDFMLVVGSVSFISQMEHEREGSYSTTLHTYKFLRPNTHNKGIFEYS